MSTVLLGFFGYGVMSDRLVRPLEKEYRLTRDFDRLKHVKWIVVLSGGASVDPELPLSTFLTGACLSRLLEGVYIHNRLPGTKLVLTGRSNPKGIITDADVMGDVAKEWGVNPENIVLETKATDTKDHPIYVKKIVGGDNFILVTSVWHMPRAMGLFRGQGMEPIPAPTDYMFREREGGLTPGVFFPNAGSLKKAERVIHEYLGMVWGRVRGQM